MLFFPAIALAFASSAFAPVADLAGWMQPAALANPVTAAAAVLRSLADGGPIAIPLLELACWTGVLILIPGLPAVRRWQSQNFNPAAAGKFLTTVLPREIQ